MGSTAFVSSGLEFVPNNYAAPLVNKNAPKAFHLMQNFFAQSPIRRALVEPERLSGFQIKSFRESGIYDDGGDSGTPSILFEFQETEYVITPGMVRAAMGFGEHTAYTIVVGDAELLRMMREIGYGGSLDKIGQLKRPFLRKEWSFFFDCITRTFGKKCTNWDAIPTDSLQIGYSLLYGNNFDFGRLVLSNVGEKMTENRGVVYFARVCQLLFSACVSGVDIIDADVIPCFKLHKRIFSDLVNKDVKKGHVGDLLLPALVQQFLDNSTQTDPKPKPINTEIPPSTSQPIQTGGRINHRAFKPAKTVKPATEVGVSKSSVPKSVGPSKKRRAKRPRSDDEEDTETLHQSRRRLVADYLFDELDTEAVPEAEQNEAPNVVTQEVDVNIEATQNDVVEATVPTEDRVNVDELVEDNDVVNIRADAAHADVDNFVDPLDMNFEAHPTTTFEELGSVGDTEDVAADQPTVVMDESLATHTEIISVTHQIVEVIAEIVVETIAVNAENEVDAQDNINSEKLANADVPETFAKNIPASSNAKSSAKSNDHADSSSQRLSAQQNQKDIQHATELHFQNMYFSKWSDKDCIFTDQRAADFVTKSAGSIANPELLTHLKATIVQVKSLHNRFDETQKEVTGLRNDVTARELNLKHEKISLSREQDAMKTRLSKIEENQTVMSAKIDSIATSLELLTSVLIPDDVKKGERVSKDKCKRTQTLRQRDDATDGGSKEAEKRSKIIQEQGRLRSNSAKLTNSGRVNSGAQSSSRLKSLVISANPITDEEIAAKLFLEEHGGEATVEDMDAEMQILAEEHKKKVEAGTYKKKAAKAPRRKEQGISIEENVNSQQSLQYSRRPVGASTDKGKGKLIEEPELSKKAHSTSDMAQLYKLN
ncbi:hypothetical protein POM88_045091 [Heracleum sosnowskyi]|uniref:Uncharacterized protein n=1 Tax=Heracleum sosnowskyi TaxID=360622 RepID=A0AAD8M5W2_9APIA|nr:hypothetical protein POM88_045091 [Heracleum sosnowskyi]